MYCLYLYIKYIKLHTKMYLIVNNIANRNSNFHRSMRCNRIESVKTN